MSKQITGKFAVEFSAGHNYNTIWPPTQTQIRGRWDHTRTPMTSTAPEYLKLMREFPSGIQGMCVEIDVDKRRLRVYDPYSQPESKETTQRLLSLSRDLAEAGRGVQLFNGTVEDVVYERATVDQVKEWLYYARQWLDAKMGIVVTGRGLSSDWPTMEEVQAMPGKVKIGYFNEREKPEYKFEVAEV